VESVYSAVRTESLYTTDTRLWRVNYGHNTMRRTCTAATTEHTHTHTHTHSCVSKHNATCKHKTTTASWQSHLERRHSPQKRRMPHKPSTGPTILHRRNFKSSQLSWFASRIPDHRFGLISLFSYRKPAFAMWLTALQLQKQNTKCVCLPLNSHGNKNSSVLISPQPATCTCQCLLR
jgi:hypothetical protein